MFFFRKNYFRNDVQTRLQQMFIVYSSIDLNIHNNIMMIYHDVPNHG